MSSRSFKYLLREGATSQYCCVPLCDTSSRCNSVVSFHTFPLDKETRKKWIYSIRRADYNVTSNSRVCSRHFKSDDLIEPSTPTGRRLLKKGSVPTLFEWNNYLISTPRRSGVWQRREVSVPMDFQQPEHDYCSAPVPAAVDLSSDETEDLRKVVERLRTQVEEMSVRQSFCCFSSCPASPKRSEPKLLQLPHWATYLKGNEFQQKLLLNAISRTRDVGCQTESPQLHSVGTQLSKRTLQSHYRSTGAQTTVSSQSLGTSAFSPAARATSMSSTPVETPSKRPRMELEEDDGFIAGCSSVVTAEESDVTHDPADTSLTEPADIATQASTPVQNIRKYIVYETCIMELFESCPVCQQRCDVRSQTHGTFLRVDQLCQHCNFSRKWNSQPIMGSTPAGNIHLSCAVYLCGASYITLEKVFAAMRLQVFRYNTFRSHARMYIEPAIVYKWKNWQDGMLNQMSRKEKVILGGDMRADSTGRCAKFGSYTMMELQTNTIVDIQLVQSNEVGGGYHMEKEGLKRSLELLEARGVTLDCIVTDRHPQIQKFLRDKNVTQFYDVWHIEKGISKQLDKIAKLKGCEKLRKWLPSIKNHIYWTAASSTTGPERVAKLTSMLNHIQDKHTHEDPHFPACLHAQRISRDKSKWLAAGTLLFYKLEKVLSNKRILKDVTKLNPHHQTSSVESFYSVILRFAQKNVVFSFIGMLCRLYLAALHFNENASRPQATTAEGQPQFKGTFPKAKKEVKTEATCRYVDDLLDLIFDKVFVVPAPYVEEVLRIPIPPPLSAKYERPEKEDVSRGGLKPT